MWPPAKENYLWDDKVPEILQSVSKPVGLCFQNLLCSPFLFALAVHSSFSICWWAAGTTDCPWSGVPLEALVGGTQKLSPQDPEGHTNTHTERKWKSKL